MSDIGALLGAALASQGRRGSTEPPDIGEDRQLPIPEAAIEVLKVACKKYVTPHTFKVGDIVQVESWGDLVGSRDGRPYIVIEVPEKPFRNFELHSSKETGYSSYGRSLDVRVMSFDGDSVSCFWSEAYSLKHYGT